MRVLLLLSTRIYTGNAILFAPARTNTGVIFLF